MRAQSVSGLDLNEFADSGFDVLVYELTEISFSDETNAFTLNISQYMNGFN